MQRPLVRQHRPEGVPAGQVAGPHAEPGPRKTPPACWQALADRIWQDPPGRQHAPVGVEQLKLAHCVPGPRQTPFSPAHAACVAAMQFPLGRQQAPDGAGQLAVAQVVPLPR